MSPQDKAAEALRELIRETLNGGEVQDLHQIINAALAEHAAVAMMTNAGLEK